MIKVDWLSAGVLQREDGAGLVAPRLVYNLRILSANEKQEMVADNVFLTLLTNTKQGKLQDPCE
jgi:hypothetical protein